VLVLLSFAIIGRASNQRLENAVGDGDSAMTNDILSIGLHPSAVDYSKYPGIDEAMLTARIEAGEAALRAAGFDFISCQVPADPDDSEARLRDCAESDGPFRIAMIGAGVRMAPEHTALFERIINVINEISPGITFCFNTTPDTTLDALRRVA
jgi:hypothetical protein